MSGSSTYGYYNPGGNPKVIEISYDGVIIEEEVDEGLSTWIYALIIAAAVLVFIALIIGFYRCCCAKSKKQRADQRNLDDENEALNTQGVTIGEAIQKGKPIGLFEIGVPLQHRPSLNGPTEETNQLYGSYVIKD